MEDTVTGTNPSVTGTTTSPALAVALDYFRAWTGHDLDRAMTYVAEDVVCDAPAGRLEGVAALRGYLGPFSELVTGADVLAAYGDDQTAVLMYDPHSTLVEHAPSAERFTVTDGRIVHSILVFDRKRFDEARDRAT